MSDRRYGIFDALLSDLTAIRPDIRDAILCPLCLRPFRRSALDKHELDTRKLTEEHIIPEALGGKVVTLTCKVCNNTQGSALDAHFIKKVRMDEALSGYYGSIPSEVHIAGHRMFAQVEWQKGSMEARIQNQGSNPAEIEAVQHLSPQDVREIQIKMCLGYRPNRSRLSAIRSAYLAMFHEFGYRYILNDSVGRIRQLICQEDLSNELLEFMLIEEVKLNQNIQGLVNIYPVTQFTSLPFYLVLIRLSLHSIIYKAIIMPDIVPNAIDVYREIDTLSRDDPRRKLKFTIDQTNR